MFQVRLVLLSLIQPNLIYAMIQTCLVLLSLVQPNLI